MTGGMPEMVFEYILKNNGIDPAADLEIDQSIDFGSTAAAFTGDASAAFTVEFEPSATALEKEGAGYVVASLGVDSGYVPYTSYSAKTSFLNENPQVIQSFTTALQKGMDYVQSHTPEEIAQILKTTWDLGFSGGVLITNPIPAKYSLDEKVMNDAIDEALRRMNELNIKGKETTPYLLATIKDITGGESLASNIELVFNNCKLAAQIAKDM